MSRHGPWTDEDVAFEGAGEETCLFAGDVFEAALIFGGCRFRDVSAGDDVQADEEGLSCTGMETGIRCEQIGGATESRRPK